MPLLSPETGRAHERIRLPFQAFRRDDPGRLRRGRLPLRPRDPPAAPDRRKSSSAAARPAATATRYDAEILRHMRPTLSELGEYDGTALMEFKTRKEIIYRINRETVCTYEMDDAPPFEIDDAGPRPAPSAIALLLRLQHRQRGAHHPQAVPRRQHPDRLPAHGHRRHRRRHPLPGPQHPHPSSSASRRTPAARSATAATAAPTAPTAWACRSSRRSPTPTCARPQEVAEVGQILRWLVAQHRPGAHRPGRRPPGRERQRHAAAPASRSRACRASRASRS